MIVTGHDLIAAALEFEGQPYSTAPGRDDPDSGHKDCSGTITAAYRLAWRRKGEDRHLGANVSVTIFALCADLGLVIPREEAYGIAGACLLKPENALLGWGPAGHIAFSDGEGGTVEATPPRVQRLSLSYNAPWSTRACLLPGIAYHPAPEPPDAPQEDDVVIVTGQTVYGVPIAAVYSGDVLGDVFEGPCTNDYGVPDAALAWNTEPGRGLRFVYLDPQRLGEAVTPAKV